MSWQDLLTSPETRTLPWLGGHEVADARRRFRLRGGLPVEHGWHRFSVEGRRARWEAEDQAPLDFERRLPKVRGYLVGDRLIRDEFAGPPDPHRVFEGSERVHLVERGLPRFARVLAARGADGLLFVREEFPVGPEGLVEDAWDDGAEGVEGIPEVPPALVMAFAWMRWQELLTEERRQRLEAERQRREREAEERRLWQALQEEERARREAARAELRQAVGRRRDAETRFDEAARAALHLSGAELLSFRDAPSRGEVVVRFRFRAQRFECVVRKQDLRIVDSGICLEDHATGERGDTRFTLESLPSVIGEAIDTGRLHRWRYA